MLARTVTLDWILDLSEPSMLHLQNGPNNYANSSGGCEVSGMMQAKGQLWAWHIEYAPEIREIIAAAVVVIITVVRIWMQ